MAVRPARTSAAPPSIDPSVGSRGLPPPSATTDSRERRTAFQAKVGLRFRVVHPFHPLQGETFECLGLHREHGVYALVFVDRQGERRSIPYRWTDWTSSGPEVAIARTPVIAPLCDLLQLAETVHELRAQVGGTAILPQGDKDDDSTELKGILQRSDRSLTRGTSRVPIDEPDVPGFVGRGREDDARPDVDKSNIVPTAMESGRIRWQEPKTPRSRASDKVGLSTPRPAKSVTPSSSPTLSSIRGTSFRSATRSSVESGSIVSPSSARPLISALPRPPSTPPNNGSSKRDSPASSTSNPAPREDGRPLPRSSDSYRSSRKQKDLFPTVNSPVGSKRGSGRPSTPPRSSERSSARKKNIGRRFPDTHPTEIRDRLREAPGRGDRRRDRKGLPGPLRASAQRDGGMAARAAIDPADPGTLGAVLPASPRGESAPSSYSEDPRRARSAPRGPGTPRPSRRTRP